MATGQKRIFTDVTQTVGNTPIVRLNDHFATEGTELLVKLEYFNPTASVKDRLSVGAIDFAERNGQLRPGRHDRGGQQWKPRHRAGRCGAAARGYRVVIVIYEDTSYERKASRAEPRRGARL